MSTLKLVRRSGRHLAVATASLFILFAAASYAFAPMSEAIAASAVTVADHGGTSIEGKILEGKSGAKGLTVTVVARVRVKVHGHYRYENKVVGKATIGANGKFSIHVPPGTYSIQIKDGSKAHKTLSVTVRKGKSIYIAGTVKHQASGVFSIAPVVFNY